MLSRLISVPLAIGAFFTLGACASVLSEDEEQAYFDSEDLRRYQSAIKPYILPEPFRGKRISGGNIQGKPYSQLVEIYKTHGVDLTLSESLSEETIRSGFSNLTMQHALGIYAKDVNGHWLYSNGEALLFRNIDELAPKNREAFERKLYLDIRISREKRRVQDTRNQKKFGSLWTNRLPWFVKLHHEETKLKRFDSEDRPLREVVEALEAAMRKTEAYERNANFEIILLLDDERYGSLQNLSFSDASTQEILDALCDANGLLWTSRHSKIYIAPKEPENLF